MVSRKLIQKRSQKQPNNQNKSLKRRLTKRKSTKRKSVNNKSFVKMRIKKKCSRGGAGIRGGADSYVILDGSMFNMCAADYPGNTQKLEFITKAKALMVSINELENAYVEFTKPTPPAAKNEENDLDHREVTAAAKAEAQEAEAAKTEAQEGEKALAEVAKTVAEEAKTEARYKEAALAAVAKKEA